MGSPLFPHAEERPGDRGGASRSTSAGQGLIVAAPASGSGKTLVTLGLLRALRERGVRVAAAKAGPDYIDPSFHALASGGPCVNLDPWAMRPATLAGLIGRLASTADLVLCEGVMGLFDGTGPDGEAGSTAELARLTSWPVVLVVDARHQGASAAALVAGFARHDPAVRVAGVIFNRVAGPRHRAILEAAMARHVPDIAVLGALPYDPALALPERHLGLVPAGERAGAETAIARAAETVAAGIDLERLMALSQPIGPHPNPPPQAGEGRVGVPPLGQCIAIARDDAFVFAYPATLESWRKQGAHLSFFAPLADEAPAPGADCVYLPGGYPELHAGRLAGCARFLAGLRRARSVYGECGGYMVMGETLTDAGGDTHNMAGLLPLSTSFAARRLHLGYREVRLLGGGPLGAAGMRFRGHEFHYATIVAERGERLYAATDSCGLDLGPAGLRRGSAIGSFIHLIDRAD
ncbi:MAG TPA: cobyrinate a,c-diamide synthase [Stellaceae bacterium]|nr:cobyrinate a,c-diamide synthase [Stellaceae bacterium]